MLNKLQQIILNTPQGNSNMQSTLFQINPSIEQVSFYLEKGTNINRKDSLNNYTLLMYACINGNEELVYYLVNKGAKLDHISYNHSPLILSCIYNHYEITKYLIKKGSKINLQNHNDNRALSFACRNRNYKMCKLLVDHGADVSHINSYGFFPLYLTLFTYHYDYRQNEAIFICGLLIKNGVKISNETRKKLHRDYQLGKYGVEQYIKYIECLDIKLVLFPIFRRKKLDVYLLINLCKMLYK